METACADGHSRLSLSAHTFTFIKGKGVCVRDVCAIYDNNISPSLLMIIIKIIILYFIHIRHTDAFPPTGTLLVLVNDCMMASGVSYSPIYKHDDQLFLILQFLHRSTQQHDLLSSSSTHRHVTSLPRISHSQHLRISITCFNASNVCESLYRNTNLLWNKLQMQLAIHS